MVFVASPIEIYYNQDAYARLATTNDSRFASERGILAVDGERWRDAQEYERDTWLVYNLGAVGDRNDQHSEGFAHYGALPQDLGDYIELGCGPFTNTRYIVGGRVLASLTLLDPLIEDYEAEHPNCAYKGWQIGGHRVTPVAGVIEDWSPRQTFDTVVMTNVLPHCFDALAVFETVRRILRPGGYFVFHEDPRPFDPSALYDVGHPLVVTQEVMDEFLTEFEQVYRSGNYFIGRRPGEATSPEPEIAAAIPEPAEAVEVWPDSADVFADAVVAEPAHAPKRKGKRK